MSHLFFVFIVFSFTGKRPSTVFEPLNTSGRRGMIGSPQCRRPSYCSPTLSETMTQRQSLLYRIFGTTIRLDRAYLSPEVLGTPAHLSPPSSTSFAPTSSTSRYCTLGLITNSGTGPEDRYRRRIHTREDPQGVSVWWLLFLIRAFMMG